MFSLCHCLVFIFSVRVYTPYKRNSFVWHTGPCNRILILLHANIENKLKYIECCLLTCKDAETHTCCKLKVLVRHIVCISNSEGKVLSGSRATLLWN